MNPILDYLPGNFSSRYANVFKRVLQDPYLNEDVKRKVKTPEFLQQVLEYTQRNVVNKEMLETGLNYPLTDAGQKIFDVFLNNMVVEAYNFKWNPFYRNFYVAQLTEDEKVNFIETTRG